MPRKRYKLQLKSSVTGWTSLFPFEGSRDYCLGALHMLDSHYPCDPARVISIDDNAIIEETQGRNKVTV